MRDPHKVDIGGGARKLTSTQAATIRSIYSAWPLTVNGKRKAPGVLHELAKRFNVSRSAINMIVHNKRYSQYDRAL